MEKSFKIIIFLAVVLIILLILFLIFPSERLKTGIVCFADNCFEVEVAETPTQRQKGLMFRDYLDKNRGMLFIFEKEGNYSFWMKNTLIELDMIWINGKNEVIFIKENAEPCGDGDCLNIDPQQNAKYVLELNGGVAKDIDLKVGDKISFKSLTD